MNYDDKKIVGIIATNVEARVALNVIGHLCIAIGAHKDETLMGNSPLIDGSNKEHLGISRYPFIVTKVKPSKLKSAIELAKANSNLLVADYPKEMLDTRTDEELHTELGKRKEEDIEYLGAIIYGNTEDVNFITGKFQLWNKD